MVPRILIVFVYVIVCFSDFASVAQGEANIWYFGNNAGLDFNNTPPTPLLNSALSTLEGGASIADKNGALLFYTDGITVWDKTHTPMPNGTGLNGDQSTIQSAVIVPYPGTYNYSTECFDKYFIVTSDDWTGTEGVCYSEVDMTLNAGLGDITAIKNVHLFGSATSEKLCTAKHANGCDFWIISKNRSFETQQYYVYAVTPAGFDTVPVITPVISPAAISQSSTIPFRGAIKVSPDGSIIAETFASRNKLYIYDFDNSYGTLNFRYTADSIYFDFDLGAVHGLEFSPNSNFIYSIVSGYGLLQHDLSANSGNAFTASKYHITTGPYGALQLASDGKIYVALGTFMGVINDPNQSGNACNYVNNQQSLGGKSSIFSLPAIIHDLTPPPIPIISNSILVIDSCVTLGLASTANITAYNWSIAHTASPNVSIYVSHDSTLIVPIDNAGDYIVSVITNYGCYTDTLTDTFSLSQSHLPIINFISTSATCLDINNGTISATVSGSSPPYTYLWSNAATTDSISNLAPGVYMLTVTDAHGCIRTDTSTVTSPVLLTVTVTAFTNIGCYGGNNGTATANASGGTTPYNYSWSSGDTINAAAGLQAGTYTITVSDSNACAAIDSVTITTSAQLTVSFLVQDITCNSGNDGIASVMVSGGTTPYSYSWTSGSTTDTAYTLAAGDYILTVTDSNNCTAIDTATVQEPSAISIVITPSLTDCDTASGTATAVPANGNSPYSYSWTTSPPQTTATANGLDAGTYTVTVTDVNGCTQTEQVSISPKTGATVSIAANPTTINQSEVTQLLAAGMGSYLWTPVTGLGCTGCQSPTASPQHTTTYCVMLTDSSGCTDSACVTITVETPCGKIEVPTAFSPNNDGHNDSFVLQGLGNCVESFSFMIFDRWGEKVFETKNSSTVWDGTYKGNPMNAAVFVYYLNVTFISGEQVTKSGNVSLIR